jgi:hypothetical protein
MGAYVPPFSQDQWLKRFGFMDAAGDRWWPFAGGVYFLHAVKRVRGMRLIMPRWRPAIVTSGNVVALRRVRGRLVPMRRTQDDR